MVKMANFIFKLYSIRYTIYIRTLQTKILECSRQGIFFRSSSNLSFNIFMNTVMLDTEACIKREAIQYGRRFINLKKIKLSVILPAKMCLLGNSRELQLRTSKLGKSRQQRRGPPYKEGRRCWEGLLQTFGNPKLRVCSSLAEL